MVIGCGCAGQFYSREKGPEVSSSLTFFVARQRLCAAGILIVALCLVSCVVFSPWWHTNQSTDVEKAIRWLEVHGVTIDRSASHTDAAPEYPTLNFSAYLGDAKSVNSPKSP
jgi:hypothetical protein